jgi:hypothetical protein
VQKRIRGSAGRVPGDSGVESVRVNHKVNHEAETRRPSRVQGAGVLFPSHNPELLRPVVGQFDFHKPLNPNSTIANPRLKTPKMNMISAKTRPLRAFGWIKRTVAIISEIAPVANVAHQRSILTDINIGANQTARMRYQYHDLLSMLKTLVPERFQYKAPCHLLGTRRGLGQQPAQFLHRPNVIADSAFHRGEIPVLRLWHGAMMPRTQRRPLCCGFQSKPPPATAGSCRAALGLAPSTSLRAGSRGRRPHTSRPHIGQDNSLWLVGYGIP